LGQRRFRFVLSQIEHHRLFAPVDPDEIRRFAMDGAVVAASEIAFGPFDLDHPCTCIGEMAGAERGCNGLLERNDDDVFQWFFHGERVDSLIVLDFLNRPAEHPSGSGQAGLT
jgi:hypothetical protein